MKQTRLLLAVLILIVTTLSVLFLWKTFSTVTRYASPMEVALKENLDDASKCFDGVCPRFFEPRPLPCFPAPDDWQSRQQQPLENGFLYLKPYKCGSSTASGIHLRIAVNAGARLHNDSSMCETRHTHGQGNNPAYRLFSRRNTSNSFLWTIIRDPTKRAISHFFHRCVGRLKQEPSDANFIRFLNDATDYYLRSMYTRDTFDRHLHNSSMVANHILQDYDFIAITERMDESAVALTMLLDLKISDVLYLSAKVHGGYDGWTRCTYIWPSFVTEGVQNYLDSERWQGRIRTDLALYRAANRSLDLTIEKLGRERFEKRLKLFRDARIEADRVCLPTAKFPCNSAGAHERVTDCIWMDSGCGKHCLDDIGTPFDDLA